MTHEVCKRQLNSNFPIQVLDVGRIGNKEVSLCISHEETAPFTALSNCWGEGGILRTTKALVIAHTTSIKWPALSKTFQEAILIT